MFKLISTIICLTKIQTHLINAQNVFVLNRNLPAASRSSSVEFAVGVSPLLNGLYQLSGQVLNGLPNLYNFGNQANSYDHQQYQQTYFQGYSSNYNRPYTYTTQQPFQQWPGNNVNRNNYNIRRPDNNNFLKNPSFNQNVPIGVNYRPQQFQTTNPQANLAARPSWIVQPSNQNYQGYQQNKATAAPNIATTSQKPWSSSRPQNSNNIQNGLISQTAEDPLNVNRVISGPTETTVSKPNYVGNPSQTKPDLAELRPPPATPWSSSQSDLVNEPVNNFEGDLISEIADDPLNLKNTHKSPVSEPAKISPLEPETSHLSPPEKPKPATITNPDSTYYNPADDYNADLSAFIDVRSN